MKFTIDRAEFEAAVQAASDVVPAKSTLPVLSNVMANATSDGLELIATDLDVFIVIRVPATVEEEGKFTLPAKRLGDIVREFEGEAVLVETTGNLAELSSARSKFKLMGISADEFPNLPDMGTGDRVSIPGSVLDRMIWKTSYSVSRDETRPALNGVLWEIEDDGMTMAATDGHRLARFKISGDFKKLGSRNVIIPPKPLKLLQKLLSHSSEDVEIGVVIGENHAIFSVGDSTIYLRLLEGPFPNYRQVIPKDNDKSLVINRESLAGATKRMSIMASSLTHQIKFSISGDQLGLSVITPDVGEAQEMLGASYAGEALDIGYNANYILEALRHMEGEDVEFKFKEAVTAGLVTEAEPVEGEDYMCLVMPLRLSEQ